MFLEPDLVTKEEKSYTSERKKKNLHIRDRKGTRFLSTEKPRMTNTFMYYCSLIVFTREIINVVVEVYEIVLTTVM